MFFFQINQVVNEEILVSEITLSPQKSEKLTMIIVWSKF